MVGESETPLRFSQMFASPLDNVYRDVLFSARHMTLTNSVFRLVSSVPKPRFCGMVLVAPMFSQDDSGSQRYDRGWMLLNLSRRMLAASIPNSNKGCFITFCKFSIPPPVLFSYCKIQRVFTR